MVFVSIVDAIAVKQCLWDEMFNALASESLSDVGYDNDLYSSETSVRQALQTADCAQGNAASDEDNGDHNHQISSLGFVDETEGH